MYHGLAFLALHNTKLIDSKTLKLSKYFLLFGIILFSGSIYTSVILKILLLNFKFINILTPIGGLLIVFGWFIVVFDFILSKTKESSNN